MTIEERELKDNMLQDVNLWIIRDIIEELSYQVDLE